MRTTYVAILVGIFVSFSSVSFSQTEQAPLKSYTYVLSLSHLKTESQAKNAESDLKNLDQISSVDIVFLDYELTFKTTNHALEKQDVLEEIKGVLGKNGIQIQKVERNSAEK